MSISPKSRDYLGISKEEKEVGEEKIEDDAEKVYAEIPNTLQREDKRGERAYLIIVSTKNIYLYILEEGKKERKKFKKEHQVESLEKANIILHDVQKLMILVGKNRLAVYSLMRFERLYDESKERTEVGRMLSNERGVQYRIDRLGYWIVESPEQGIVRIYCTSVEGGNRGVAYNERKFECHRKTGDICSESVRSKYRSKLPCVSFAAFNLEKKEKGWEEDMEAADLEKLELTVWVPKTPKAMEILLAAGIGITRIGSDVELSGEDPSMGALGGIYKALSMHKEKLAQVSTKMEKTEEDTKSFYKQILKKRTQRKESKGK